MMTAEFIEDNFTKTCLREGELWCFTPKRISEARTHRYLLYYLAAERRFALTRQEIRPFVTISDEEQVQEFRGMLPPEEIAECIRKSLRTPPALDDDQIPF